MMRKTLLVAAALTLSTAALSAQDRPEAWLARVKASAKLPVIADQSYTVFAGQTMTGEGKLVLKDERYFRIETTMTATGPNLSQPITTSMLNVGDGETLWMEVTDGYQKTHRVKRIPLDDMDAWAQSDKQFAFSGTFHPANRALDLVDYVEFEDVERDGDTVILQGKITEDAKQKLINQFRGAVPREFKLVLDAETAFPISFELNSYQRRLVSFEYKNVKFPEPDEFDAAHFEYELPEGVTVETPPAPPAGSANSKKPKQDSPRSQGPQR